MTGKDRKRAVDLFGENDAGKFVWHGERGERDFLFRGGAQLGGESLGVSAKENEFPGAAVAQIAEPVGELPGSELFAGGVKENDRRAWFDFNFTDGGRARFAQFVDFNFRITLDAVEIIAEKNADFFAAGFAEHDESDFHGAKESRSARLALLSAKGHLQRKIPGLKAHYKIECFRWWT
jgi:hypothetical protein